MTRPWKIAAVAVFTASILLGGLVGDRVLALSDDAREWLRLYTELVEVTHENYGGEVTYSDLVNSSIAGMVRTLDPHTNFLPPQAYENMRQRQQTSFHGLGILVGMRHGQLTVITPIEGTPASRLGIRAGDVIATIEGESTDSMALDEAVRQLKGPKGTQVRITIARRGLDIPLELTITRDEIPQNTVRHPYMITPGTGYLAISDFNRGTGQEVADALNKLKNQGMESLIVDLRTNGGGLLDQAIAVAEQFLPAESKIVETRGRTRDSFQEFSGSDGIQQLGLPIVVLVSNGTASAAEIFAGAIQDHDVGLIVGEPTWGKGLVQTVYSLSYGAGIALTTAKYYTPSGRLIQRDYSSYFDYQSRSQDLPQVASIGENEVFHTDLGREVFGGGGITPDILVEPQELEASIQYLLSSNAFFDFAVDYTRVHKIKSTDWKPSPELVTEFSEWLSDNNLASEQELADIFEQPDGDEIKTLSRYLHAEIFNSAFGLNARYEVLADGDNQIERALEALSQAVELLAKRRQLEQNQKPEVSPVEAVG